MAKGPIVTHEVEALIASVYQKHPKWKATEVRNEVSHILRKNNSKLPSGWPSLSTVQKVLATVRRKMKELPVDLRERPWSTLSMAEYPIPAEALPTILQLWVWTLENLDALITIREAQWAARLYTVTKDMTILSIWSKGFAAEEMTYELLGLPCGGNISQSLIMFDVMTGQEMTPERGKKILGLSDEDWGYYHESVKPFHSKNESELRDVLYQMIRLFREEKNERLNKATR